MADNQPNDHTSTPAAEFRLSRVLGADQFTRRRGHFNSYCLTPGCPHRATTRPIYETVRYPGTWRHRYRCEACAVIVRGFRAIGAEPTEAQIVEARGIEAPPFDASAAVTLLRELITRREKLEDLGICTTSIDSTLAEEVARLDAQLSLGATLPGQWAASRHGQDGR